MLSKFKMMPYATLKLFIDPTEKELRELYETHVESHNASMESKYPNSGFDLIVPSQTVFNPSDTESKSVMVNMKVKTEMEYWTGIVSATPSPSPFYLYPRSSMSKTQFMLANHTGIIDSGYRGWLIGAFRSLSKNSETMERHTRLLQICHPSLCPIYVTIVDSESDISTTERGEGGFGSTGLIGSLVTPAIPLPSSQTADTLASIDTSECNR
jgi:dUTP pyrophosphatase